MGITNAHWRWVNNLVVASSAWREKKETSGRMCSAAFRDKHARTGVWVGVAAKEPMCHKSVYAHQFIDERIVSMCLELTSESDATSSLRMPYLLRSGKSQISTNTELKETRFLAVWSIFKADPTGSSVKLRSRRRFFCASRHFEAKDLMHLPRSVSKGVRG